MLFEHPDHPMIGGYGGGVLNAYNHPMWGAVAAGAVALQVAANANADAQARQLAIAQTVADTNAATLAVAQDRANQAALQAQIGGGLKGAIDAHLTTADQIINTPAPTLLTNATASLHITAARQLLAQA